MNSLIKSTWEFIHTHKITLEHDIAVPQNTKNDLPLMPLFHMQNPTIQELESINHCRIHLQAYYLSDIATASGTNLSYHAWEGVPRYEGRTTQCTWPHQGLPSKTSWNAWQRFLKKTVLGRGIRLKDNLGPWLRRNLDIWKWYYSPQFDSLICIEPTGMHMAYNRLILLGHRKVFSPAGTLLSNVPPTLFKASVRKIRKNAWWVIDTGTFISPLPTPIYDSFHTMIQTNNHSNPWCFDYVDFPTYYDKLLIDIRNGNIWLVSDGSYHPKHRYGTAAWILEGSTSHLQITGMVITPGQASDQSAYRSKLACILAALSVLNTLATFHQLTAMITIHCDSETGIAKAFNPNNIPSLRDSSYDLLQAIHCERTNSTICWRGVHVKGHQDDNTPFELLPHPSQLNIMVDHMAKEFLHTAIESP